VNLNEANVTVVLTSLADPSSRQSVIQWLQEKKARESSDVARSSVDQSKKTDTAEKQIKADDRSQLEAASLNNTFGFQVSFGNCLEAKAVYQVYSILLMQDLSL
jgi:hypothetical protein